MTGDFIRKLRQLGLEYFGKYYGVYKGIVTKNDLGQGKINIRVPELGREDELNQPAYPISPFAGKNHGFFFPPEVGELVWVMFEGGNPALPLYLGGWWTKGNEPTDSGGNPDIREIRTKAGHRIIFNEDVGIMIQTSQGSIVKLTDADGAIEITATQQVTVKTNLAKVLAVQVNANANLINLNGQTIRVNNGLKMAAAIGDQVADPQGGTGNITGPPTTGRILIP